MVVGRLRALAAEEASGPGRGGGGSPEVATMADGGEEGGHPTFLP
jgi:hypothetical protein